MQLLCPLLTVYLIALFARIILSWFPLEPGTPMASIYRFLFTVTEPVLGPVRRIIPPVGGGGFRMDLSPIIVLIAVQLIQSRVLGC